MKKLSPRRFLILLLPSLLLFGLVTKATFFPPRAYSTQVLKVPPVNGKFYGKGEIDTKVVITFSHSSLRDWRLPKFSGGSIRLHGTLHGMGQVHFEDGEGNRLSPFLSKSRFAGWMKTGFGTYFTTYEFPRSQLPKNVTLKTEVFDGNGWKLPIEVPL